MSKSKVALVRCDSYEYEQVLGAVRKGLDLVGGISSLVKPGENIVLKPNILIGTDPAKGVTTHPSVFKAVGKLLQEARVNVFYGDSPSFGSAEWHIKKSGLKSVADELGFKLADFDNGRSVSHKNALLVKKFTIANGVLDFNGLVSLPKFKTHGLMRFTGAVKNQFGCIPGILKSQYHVKLPDPYDFGTMLVDLNSLIKPRLYILDGIMAMEGNGPRSGKLKPLGALLISSDPVALDAIACRIIGLDPIFVPTSAPGEKSGLGTYHAENIEISGEKMDSFFDPAFIVDRTPPVHRSSSKKANFIKNRITQKPVIDEKKCNRCGVCIKMCPVEPKAVDWQQNDYSKPPKHDYDLCIRCYCCQEICPEGAIYINGPVMGRIFFRG